MTVTTVTFVTRARCGRPTVAGRPCRRFLSPFGSHWICPVHIGPRQQSAPAVICPHPGEPHSAFGEVLRAWRDRAERGDGA